MATTEKDRRRRLEHDEAGVKEEIKTLRAEVAELRTILRALLAEAT